MQTVFKKYNLWLIPILVIPPLVLYLGLKYDVFIPTGDIDKSTWFSLWGDFLTFYGTLILAGITVWQNKQSVDFSKCLLNIETCRQSCNIVLKVCDNTSKIIRLSNNESDYTYSSCDMTLTVINHGDAILKKLKFTFHNNQAFSSHVVLAKGEQKSVIVRIPENLDYEKKVDVVFTSCNDITTHGDFKLSSVGESHAKIKYYHFYGLQKTEGSGM